MIPGAEEITEGIFSVGWSHNYRKSTDSREIAVSNQQDIGYVQFYCYVNDTPLITVERNGGYFNFFTGWEDPSK